jgi:hypothetical protein
MSRSSFYIFLVTVFIVLAGNSSKLIAQPFKSAQSGNFSVGTTWVGGQVPPDYEDIVISSGHTVTLDRGTEFVNYIYVYNVTIESGAILNSNGFPLYIRNTSSGTPHYINNGIHNGPGAIHVFNFSRGRVSGSGVTNCDFLIENYGLEMTATTNLTINGNIMNSPGFPSNSSGIVFYINETSGNLIVNGDMISGATIRKAQISNFTGTLRVNGNITFAGTLDWIVNRATLIISGNVTIGASSSSTLYNHRMVGEAPQPYLEIGGDLLGGGLCVFRNANDAHVKFGGMIFPAGFGGTLALLSPTDLNTVEYNGTAAQVVKPFGAVAYRNLIINNSSLAGVTFSDNITVNGTFSLNNGHVHLSNKNLTLGESAIIGGSPSADAMVVATGSGELRKFFGGTGSFTFPVGDSDGLAEYSPVTLEFTSGTFTSGHVGINLKNESYYPGFTGSHIKRYWNISSNGISAFNSNIALKYNNDDVIGNESMIRCYRFAPDINHFSFADTDLKLLAANGLTAFGVFSGQTQFLPGKNSAQSGNFSDGSTWVGGVAPVPFEDIVIRSGHNVTLDASGKQIHDMTIEAGAIFDNGNFDLTIFRSGGNPTYKNDGIHNSGTGNLILFNNFHTRVRGTGVSNINFNVRDYGIQPLFDCDLTINGNLQYNASVTYQSRTLINNSEGGTITINGDIIPHPSKGITIINQDWETYEANITINGNADLSTVENSVNSQAGTIFDNYGKFTVTGDLLISPEFGYIQNYGEITIGGDLLGSGTGDDFVSYFDNQGLLKIGGNIFPAAPNLGNLSVGLNSTVEYFGNSHQTIFNPWDHELNPDGPYNNLIINNSSLAGVTFSDNITVNGTFSLNNGHVHLSNNNLILGESAVIGGSPSSGAMVIATGSGELRKNFNSASAFTFPVGNAGEQPAYTPLSLSFDSGTFSEAYVGVNLSNTAYPGSSNNYLKRFWNISGTGITDFGCDALFQYAAEDVVGNESLIYCFMVSPETEMFSQANSDLQQLSAGNLNALGTFTGKEQENLEAPYAFNVLGGGTYCESEAGLPVGLDGSQQDVSYTLYKNSIPQTPTIQGTGVAISFGTQLFGTYTISGTNAQGTIPMNGFADIIAIPVINPSVSIMSNGEDVCQDASVAFTAFPENGGTTPAYQWKVNGQNAGTNTSTFNYTPLDDDQVQVVMTSSLTCVTGNPASSNVIAMTVNPNLPAGVSISATQNSVCQGTSVTITAFPENGGATPAYQWKVNGQNAGTNNSTFTYSPLDGDQVQVVMTSSLTCITGNPASSNVIAMTVSNSLPASVSISVTQSIICYGDLVIFTAFPENGGAAPAYQWKVNGQNAGTNNSTFTYSPLDGDQVQVVMTSSLTCISGNPASSNVIAMTVSNSLLAGVSISATQSIICYGDLVIFTAFPENGGATPAYQWKVNGQNAGTNNSTFTYSPLDGDQVQVVMTSSLTCISGNPASSNVIAMTVSNSLPAGVSITTTQNSVCQGTPVSFTAFPENGGAAPAYQWKVNGQNAGNNNSTFTYSPLDGDQVQVVMTSSLTCISGNPASSNVIAMTVSNSLPAGVSITTTQNSVCQGTPVSFTAFPENGGAAPAYQWKVNGQNAGNNNSTFTYSPLDGDQVQVVMTSSLTCISGNPASSNVIAMTVSNSLPAGVSITTTQNSVCQGTPVSFTAFPENGGVTPAYQWKVNGQNAGTNNSAFNYAPNNNDQVQVVMTSSSVCVLNNPAISNTIEMAVNPVEFSLIANPMQGGTVNFTGTPLIGQSIILTAVPANGWVFANWTNNLGDVISTNAIFNFAITVCNQTITANFNTTNLITGKLAYFNPLETSIPTPNPNGAFYVQIFDNMIPASSPQQIVTGMPFSFSGLETGKSYTMRLWEQSADNLVGNTWTWNNYGGVTALDALIVSYMGIQNPVLSSFPWILSEGEYTPFFMNVADANNSSSITSLDALILLYRSIGDPLTIPFPGGKHNFQVAGKKLSEINEMVYPNAPDILFNPSGIYAASSQTSSVFYEAILPAIESGTSIFNIYLVATGDVNVSYDLVNQTKLKSALSFEGVTVGNVNDEMLIPVKLKHSSELAAASIAFSYSHDIVEVVDIVGIDVYSIDHNEGIVRIAWMDEKGKFFDENDQLFSLKLRILKDINEGTSYLELLSGTEFSDKSATVLNDVVLTANYIETSPTSVLDHSKPALTHSVFPNPFKDMTNIQYTLPVSGKVKVRVFNYLGQEVKLLADEFQPQGTHKLTLNNTDLNGAGSYIYEITFEANNQILTQRGTIMFAK